MTFLDTVRSEWVKFRTLRSSTYALIATLVLGIGMSVLFTAGRGEGYARLSAADRAAFDSTESSLTGAVLLAQVALGTLGVLMVTGEYGTGMIRTSLTVVPRRGRLFTAKALVILLVSLVLGEIVVFGSFLLSQWALTEMRVPSASLDQVGVLFAVAGTGVYLALVAVLGTAVGTLMRATAGAVVVVVMITVIVPYFFTALLPPVVQTLWPTIVGMAVMSTRLDSGLPAYGPIVIMAAEVGVVAAAAYAVFRLRDV